ncbi:hypothetical protein BDV28DRAFT_144963 [Aspergillus coremiiformis]|uniref:Chromo domain-containing protein n=1 Tax=Aspergillus coremiiformis TaxID=138285 RepID=A0A5N6ZG46_9EURO|nr:hypothetical protein BDV28DRAFT_144963 [Aspergillus coremiiformis]
MTDASDDDISLTSTVPSPPKENYYVDTIHAERQTSHGIEYLVGWEDYPIERSSWETASQFDDDQTLLDWDEKKREILAGRRPEFDLTDFNKRILKAEQVHQERKRRRHAKRERLAKERLEQPNTESSIDFKGFDDAARLCPQAADVHSNKGINRSQIVPGRSQLYGDGPARPHLVGFGTGLGGQIRARPRRSYDFDPAATPKRFKNLSTKNRCQKARAYEPAPDISKLELIRPSMWPSTSAAHGARPGPQPITTINGPQLGESLTKKCNGASGIDMSVSQPQTPLLTDSHSPKHASPDTCDPDYLPDLSLDLDLPQRRPGPKAIWIKRGNYFVNPGELLCTLYYGPDKKEIGETRLCGLDTIRRNRFMRTKKGRQLEIWFQYLCNLTDYNILCQKTTNEKFWNGWIEGFDESEPGIYKFGEELKRRNLVAICIPEIKNHDVLLAYPPTSEDFGFLNGQFSGPSNVFLHTAVRSPLGPIQYVFGNQNRLKHGHLTEVNTWAVNSSQSNPTILANKQLEDLENSSEQVVRNKDNEPLIVQAPNASKGLISHSGTITITPQTTKITSRDSIPTHQKIPPDTDPMDIDQSLQDPMTAASSAKTQPTLATQLAVNLVSLFEERFGMTFDTLATVAEKGRLAGSFCVLSPLGSGGIEQQCQLLVEFLKAHRTDKYKAIIYSNHTDDDWEKFTQAKSGVVLIHEDFLDYYKLPNLYKICRQTFSFWSFSLTRESGDDRPHFQRMLPIGGVALITEDFMLHDPKSTVVILSWFAEYAKSRYPGTWKLMFRPDILNWLLRQVDTVENSKYLWLAMYHLILQIIACGDTKTGDMLTGAETGYTSSPIISPSKLPLYGSRTENDNPDIPKGLTQTERNADHLIEFFAGWALVNCYQFRKFYALTSVGPFQRWDEWQHLEIRVDSAAFMKSLEIDYTMHWEKLKHSIATSKSHSEMRPQPPFTPQTPKAGSSSESAASNVPFSYCPPTILQYPQPYQ